jgi:hypothetical protein
MKFVPLNSCMMVFLISLTCTAIKVNVSHYVFLFLCRSEGETACNKVTLTLHLSPTVELQLLDVDFINIYISSERG